MITKNVILEEAINKQIHGAMIECYKYNEDTNLKLQESYTYKIAKLDNEPEVEIKRIISNSEVYLDKDFLDNDYNMIIEKHGEDIEFSRTNVQVHKMEYDHICFPYGEYIPTKEPKLIGSGKVPCTILTIESMSKSTSTDIRGEEVNVIYQDLVNVGITESCYIYIVNYTDGSLPTILVSNKQYNEADLKTTIFKNSVPGLFNTYFHPHHYRVERVKRYEDVVFGAPGSHLKSLTFDEKKIDHDYWNSDGIQANKILGDVNVSLDGWCIAKYQEDDSLEKQNNLDNLLINHLIVVNDTQETKNDHIAYNDLVTKYYPIIDKIYEGFNKDFTFKEYRFETGYTMYQANEDLLTIVCPENDPQCCEITYINGDNIYYAAIGNKGSIIRISLFKDAEGNEYYINNTLNRSINISRDANTITYNRGAFYISTDKSNNITHTNMMISGEITPYNIYGVPEKF